MPANLIYIIFFTLIGSVFSLAGGALLLIRKELALKISHFLAAFAAGTLLGTAFFDLLPEAVEFESEIDIFAWAISGMLIFFILERLIHWFHHHHHSNHAESEASPTVPLIVLGDSLHNFIDGVVIAATFLVSFPLGVITTFAVAAHEIPQEIGDFGVLLNKGLSRLKVLQLNFLSALTALIGALLAYILGSSLGELLPALLALTAGFFIYIAASDLIPEIHHKNNDRFAFFETVLLMLGVFIVWFFVHLLEG